MRPRNLFLGLLCVLLIFGLTGCGGTQKEGGTSTKQEAAANKDGAPAQKEASANLPKVVVLGAKGAGGGFVTFTNLTKLIDKYAPFKATFTEVSSLKGALELFKKGELDLHGSGIPGVHDAYWGIRDFEKTGREKDLRIFSMGYTNYYGFRARPDRGIKSIEDLAGKKVGIILPNIPHTQRLGEGILKFYGVRDKIVDRTDADAKEASRNLLEGRVDAYFESISGGDGPEQNAALGGLVVLPVSKEAIQFLQKEDPAVFWTEDFDANFRKGWSFLPKEKIGVLTHNVPQYTWATRADDVVYEMTKAVFDHEAELQAASSQTATMSVKAAAGPPTFTIPFHPGAIKYYKEKGVWTADHDKRQEELLNKQKWDG